MTFELVSHTVLVEGAPDDAASTPFGRTGCELLPDGSYIVSVYSDTDPTDIVNIWKVSSDGDVLGHLVIDTGADEDGRMHVIALDGFLVQVLYMTETWVGAISYVVDCSGDTPVVLAQWNDEASSASGYRDAAHHLYLPSIGVVALMHPKGLSLYRRGRHLISRTGPDAWGTGFGLFPHPTQGNKFAAWFSSAEADREFTAWEYTVTPDDGLLVEELGPYVPSDTVWWMVGGGNPYATTPVILQEFDNDALTLTTAAIADVPIWTDPNTIAAPVGATTAALWSLGAWGSPVAGTANEYMANDGDGSYAHIGENQSVGTRIAVALPVITPRAEEGLAVVGRVRINTWHTGYVPINVYLASDTASTPIATRYDSVYAYGTAWQEVSVFFNGTPEVLAVLASGTAVVWAEPRDQVNTGAGDSYDIGFEGPTDEDSTTGFGTKMPRGAINSDTISCEVGDSLDLFAFAHEYWQSVGDWPNPVASEFTARCGLVDMSTGFPMVQMLNLQYGATSPAGYPDDYYYVSLITGSMDMTARNGELVISTCVVQQEGSTNYYAVISWKISLGEAGRARLSGNWDGDWRRGINNRSGLLSLQTSLGMLPEASEKTGLDAPAHPGWMKTSQGWELIGRFVEPSTVIPLGTEEFWSYTDWATPFPPTAKEYWVGAAPHLASDDTTSYAHFSGSGTYAYLAVAHLPATHIPEFSRIRITARLRLLGSWAPDPAVEFMILQPDTTAWASAPDRPDIPIGDWVTTSVEVPWEDELDWLAADIEEGDAAVGIYAGVTSAGESYDVAWVKVELLPGLGEPVPPPTVDVVYRLGSINNDLAAAIALAGPSFTQYGNTWGPFVAQAGGPPTAAQLVDGLDTTTTTLANVSDNTSSQLVEIFTARLTPSAPVPAGAQPVAVAFTTRARAPSGVAGSYLDLNISTSLSTDTIRAQGGNWQLQLATELGPSFVTSSYGIYGRYFGVPGHPGRFTGNGYHPGETLEQAMAAADEGAALWWAEQLATPGFYITVQNALTNPAHGPVEIAEMYLTVRYLSV